MPESFLPPPRTWPLRMQVRALACLLILLVAVTLGELWARRTVADLQADTGHRLAQTARSMADRLSKEMADRTRDVALLAQLDVLREGADPAAARAVLERLRATLPVYAWIGMTDADGRVVAATDDVLLGQSIAARPVFQNGRQGLWTGDVHDAVLLAALVPHTPGEAVKFVDVAAPVRRADGSLHGVLALHLSWQWANRMRVEMKPAAYFDQTQLMIFSASGQPLLGPMHSLSAPKLPPERLDGPHEPWSTEAWSDGLKAPTSIADTRATDGFRGFGWRVVARDISLAARAGLPEARMALLPVAAAFTVTCLLLTWWVIGALIAPIDRLAHSLRGSQNAGQSNLPARRNDVQRIAAAVVDLQNTLKHRDEAVQQLQQQAHADALTGLWNRAYLGVLSDRLVESMAERNAELCVLCVDLDGFKPVNDKYGHEAGDQVLVQVAKRLRKIARAEDFVFRLGGDEFMLLLSCPPGEGHALAQRMAQRVVADMQRPMTYRTLSNLRIGCSVGAGVWPQDGRTLADVMLHADEALYAAKRAGRGQYRQYAASSAGKTALPA